MSRRPAPSPSRTAGPWALLLLPVLVLGTPASSAQTPRRPGKAGAPSSVPRAGAPAALPAEPPATLQDPVGHPETVLAHLRRAGQGDASRLGRVLPADADVGYASAWWFNKHAGDMGLFLSAEELKALGLGRVVDMGYLAAGVSSSRMKEALKAGELPEALRNLDPHKLDELPIRDEAGPLGGPADRRVLSEGFQMPLVTGGVLRLMKAIPPALWPRLEVLSAGLDAQGFAILQVGLRGTAPLLQVSCLHLPEGRWVITYLYFKRMPASIARLAEGR